MEQAQSHSPEGRKPELKILSAVFPDQESVDKAFYMVTLKGYTKYELNIIMLESIRKKIITANEKIAGEAISKKPGKSSLRAAPLGAHNSIEALLSTSTSLPGTKVQLVGSVSLSLADSGSNSGGLLSILLGLEISEADAIAYDLAIQSGKIVMTVLPRNQLDRAYIKKQWIDYQAQNIN